MLTFDLSDFEAAAARWAQAADQVPFAAAQAMNDASKVAREELINSTWPQHVKVRSAGFMKSSLQREFASKRSLRISIFDQLDRGNLLLHGEGGIRRPVRSTLAIPEAKLGAKRTSRGIPKGLRPKALPNSFRKGDVIYQRTGSYHKGTKRRAGYDGRGLKLMYTLRPSAKIKASVPFEADFKRVMTREIWPAFQTRLAAAMATRRPGPAR